MSEELTTRAGRQHPASQKCRWCDDLTPIPVICADCGHNKFTRLDFNMPLQCMQCGSLEQRATLSAKGTKP